MAPPASTPPSISVAGVLCAGDGATANITISNVSDYTGYSVKVMQGSNDRTAGFTLGAIGATMTISANAGTPSGNYQIQLLKAGAVEATAPSNLTVGAPLTISIAPSAGQGSATAAFFCTGGDNTYRPTVTLTASGASTYSWKKDGSSLGGSSSAHIASAAGVYEVTGTGAAGTCPGTATITVTAETAPAVPTITPTSADLCVGDATSNATLSVVSPNGAYTYNWNPSGSGASLAVAGTAVAAGDNKYKVQANDGQCRSNFSAEANIVGHTVTVTLPSGTINIASGTPAVIGGATTGLTYNPITTAPANSITNYNWTCVTGAAINLGQGTPTVTTEPVTVETRYTLTVTDNYGCKATSNEVKLSILPASLWTVAAMPGAPVCQGDALSVSGSVGGTGTPTGTLSWTILSSSPAGLVLDAVTTTGTNPRWNVNMTTSVPGTYSVVLQATDGAGLVRTADPVTVTILEKPVLNTGDLQIVSSDICKGGDVELQVMTTLGAGVTCVWDNATVTTPSDTRKATGTIATVGTGAPNVYKVRLQHTNGCESAQLSISEIGRQVTVTISPSGSQTVPAGSIQTVTASATLNPVTGTPTPAVDQWNWTPGTGAASFATGVGPHQIVTSALGVGTHKYTVQAEDNYGCLSDPVDVTFTVGAGTVWDVNTLDVAGCFGTTIAVTGTTSGSPAAPVAWSYANKTTIQGGTLNLTGTAPNWRVDASTAPGEYTVELTATDNNSVSKTKTVNIKVYGLPTLMMSNTTPAVVCAGQQITLNAAGTFSTMPLGNYNSALNYSWIGTSGTTTASPVLGIGNNEYKVKVTDGNNCASAEQSLTVVGHSITVGLIPPFMNNTSYPVPSGSTQSVVAQATLDPTAGASVASWTWTAGTGAAAIADGANTANMKTGAILGSVSHVYTVVAKDNFGCESTPVKITFTAQTGTAWEIDANNVTLCAGTAGTVTGNLYSGSPVGLEWRVLSTVPATGLTLTPATTLGNTGSWNIATTSLPNSYAVTLEAEDDNGVKKTKTIQVVINALPVVSDLQVVSSQLCIGKTVTLEATASTTATPNNLIYIWSSNATSTGANRATGQIVSAGTATPNEYTVQVRDNNNCVSEVKKVTSVGHEVTVTPELDGKLSTATVAHGSTGLSLTASVNIVPSGTPQSYKWTATGGGSITGSTTGATATAGKLESPGSFVLEVTDNNGCVGTGTVIYNLSGGPLDVTVADNVSFCATSAAKNLTATGSGGNCPASTPNCYTYTWRTAATSPDGALTFSNANIANTRVTTTVPGTYHAEVEVSDGIQTFTKGPIVIQIDAVPAINIVSPATASSTSRVGQSVLLSATATSSTSLSWSGSPMGTPTSGATTAQATAGPFAIAGPYLYTVTAVNGACSKDSTVTINVLQNAQDIVIDPISNVEICEGFSTISLSANATGGSSSANLRYQWTVVSGDLNLASTTGKQVTANAGSVGEHRVRVTVSDVGPDPAATQSIEFTVYVYAKPVIDNLTADNKTTGAVNVTTVDIGDEVRLNVSASPVTDVLSYLWSEQAGSSTLLTTTGTTVDAGPLTATTTYTVEVTNAHMCAVKKNITIVVNQASTGAVLNLTLARECADSGKDMVLTMNPTGGNNYSFTLRNNAGTVNQSFSGAGPWTFNISLGNQDTYYVQDFKAFRNSVAITPATVSPAQIEALFYTTPSITIAGGNVQTVCEGTQLTLTASSQLNGTNFTWDKGVINGQPFTPATGTYTVTAESVQGCKATSTVSVTLAPQPDVTASATPQQICLGESVVLQAGGTATEFVWNNGQTTQMFTETPNVGGVLKYVVTGKELLNGCTDTASVTVIVNEPPVIVSASKDVRSIAIGKNVTFGVKATGKDLTYQWKRWTGSSWMSLYDSSTDTPGVQGAQTDSLMLTAVPRSWDNTRLQCVVTNSCGSTDTTFTLYVKECFDILDIEWDMCEGIRPENNPNAKVDGWYCPGTKISICARPILDDPAAEIGDAVYKWTVDGLRTSDGRWDEMQFISDSSVLSWIPPAEWQDNITVALCVYVDGACDTICKSYLRLKASPFEEVSWKLQTSLDPSNGFCGGDTVRIKANVQGKPGKNATFHWYNDIFDLHTDVSPTNELLTELDDEMLVDAIRMRLDQQDTWIKVVMTPSPEVCTEQPTYEKQVFLKLKPSVSPKLNIWTEDTLACINDEIYMEAQWENAGTNPTFQWTRSIGFPYWNLGTESSTTTVLDDKDVWIKCELFPSEEVCYTGDPVVDVIRITALTDPTVSISADQENKVVGDEIVVESDLAKMPVKNPIYTWFINNLMAVGEDRPEFISNTFRQGDKIQLGVKGGRICQNMVMSNILTIDYDNAKRDTLLVIYQGERIRNLDMFRPGDDVNEFFIAPNGYTGSGDAYMGLDGKFNYIPDPNFSGMDKVTYIVVDKFTGAVETGYIYIQVKDEEKFLVPNIITPNGDGLNDTWVLNFLQEYPDHVVTVYNRNGKVVLRAKNYQNDWDGSGQGNSGYVAYFNLPNGIYTYVIDLGDREVLKGWLEIRKDMSRGRYSR